MRACLAYMYADLLEFHEDILKLFAQMSESAFQPGPSALHVCHTHFCVDWKRTFTIYWRHYQEPFMKLLQRFDIQARALDKLAQQEHTQHVQDTNSQLTDHFLRYQDDRQELQRFLYSYEDDRTTLLNLALKQEEERKHEQYDKVQSWLSNPGDDEQRYQDRWRAERDKYPGTASWILQEQKLKDWMDKEEPDSSILWIYGKKGAGTLDFTTRWKLIVCSSAYIYRKNHTVVSNYRPPNR